MQYIINSRKITAKYICKLSKLNISWTEILFLATFSAYLIKAFLLTTSLDYNFPQYYDMYIEVTLWCCILLKLGMNKGNKRWEVLSMILLIALGMICRTYSSDDTIYYFMLFIVGAKDVDFKKIANIYLCISITIMLIALYASSNGLAPNYQYFREGGIRNSYGICYPTDFAAHILFIMITYMFVRWKRITYTEISIMFVISYMVYKGTLARNDTICMVVLCVAVLTYKIMRQFNINIRIANLKIRRYLPYVIIPVALIACISCMLYVKGSNAGFDRINEWLSNRLYCGRMGFDRYGVTLFGSAVVESGLGFGNLNTSEKYFFLDSSYVRVLIKYGIIFFVVVMALYIIISKKLIKNRMGYATVFLITIILFAISEHHFISLSYNIIFLILYADIESIKYSSIGKKLKGI